MSTVTILFGTESGNAEMVADDVCAVLLSSGLTADVAGMEDVTVTDLADRQLVLLISSTYGEGELPATALEFHAELQRLRPDLSAVRYAAFGLGDSTYDTFNLGITTLAETFAELGAQRVGEIGSHDADSGLDPSAVATSWATELVEHDLLETVRL